MIADQFFYPSTLNAKTHLTQDNRMAYELELKHILSLDIRNLLIYIYILSLYLGLFCCIEIIFAEYKKVYLAIKRVLH